MNNKYEVFIQLLNFNREKYSAEKVFKDLVSLFAISLSNKVFFCQENSERYERIYKSYEKEEQYIFYALSAEMTRLFGNEKEPYDILGEIYKEITRESYLRLLSNETTRVVGSELKEIININKKDKNGKMVEMNCGTGARILAYASTLSIFKLDYKSDLEVVAFDTDIINVFMTYIQLYFYEISAIVILMDKTGNKEIMRLYTPSYEDSFENLMIA